jgi:SAM-dependent methyltransferase
VVNEDLPKNFELIISDGVSIPVPESSISIAYSDQLMEHLHPQDAFEQLRNVYKALTKGGVYICITPNRLSGPHDISKYFDKVATGFHLKEYTNMELMRLFRKVGFSKVVPYMDGRVIPNLVPLIFYETLLGILPHSFRNELLKTLSYPALVSIVMVGKK